YYRAGIRANSDMWIKIRTGKSIRTTTARSWATNHPITDSVLTIHYLIGTLPCPCLSIPCKEATAIIWPIMQKLLIRLISGRIAGTIRQLTAFGRLRLRRRIQQGFTTILSANAEFTSVAALCGCRMYRWPTDSVNRYW